MYTVGDEVGSTANVRINAHFMAQGLHQGIYLGKSTEEYKLSTIYNLSLVYPKLNERK